MKWEHIWHKPASTHFPEFNYWPFMNIKNNYVALISLSTFCAGIVQFHLCNTLFSSQRKSRACICNGWQKRKQCTACSLCTNYRNETHWFAMSFHGISTYKIMVFIRFLLNIDFVHTQVEYASNLVNLTLQCRHHRCHQTGVEDNAYKTTLSNALFLLRIVFKFREKKKGTFSMVYAVYTLIWLTLGLKNVAGKKQKKECCKKKTRANFYNNATSH